VCSVSESGSERVFFKCDGRPVAELLRGESGKIEIAARGKYKVKGQGVGYSYIITINIKTNQSIKQKQ